MHIRGYGHVKLLNLQQVETRQAELMQKFKMKTHPALVAAE
jgi:hypothetical protein